MLQHRFANRPWKLHTIRAYNQYSQQIARGAFAARGPRALTMLRFLVEVGKLSPKAVAESFIYSSSREMARYALSSAKVEVTFKQIQALAHREHNAEVAEELLEYAFERQLPWDYADLRSRAMRGNNFRFLSALNSLADVWARQYPDRRADSNPYAGGTLTPEDVSRMFGFLYRTMAFSIEADALEYIRRQPDVLLQPSFHQWPSVFASILVHAITVGAPLAIVQQLLDPPFNARVDGPDQVCMRIQPRRHSDPPIAFNPLRAACISGDADAVKLMLPKLEHCGSAECDMCRGGAGAGAGAGAGDGSGGGLFPHHWAILAQGVPHGTTVGGHSPEGATVFWQACAMGSSEVVATLIAAVREKLGVKAVAAMTHQATKEGISPMMAALGYAANMLA